MIGAMLLSGDLLAYHTFSHASSSESRIEVESVEEVEARVTVTRSRQTHRSPRKTFTKHYDFSASFNPFFVAKTATATGLNTPRFIQFCTFLK